jgi:hypothetical protein
MVDLMLTVSARAAATHALKCVEYLLGNHVVAERLFRHDPATALYVPLGAKATT